MNTGFPEYPAKPRLLTLGDTAWTIEFGDCIDPTLHSRVLGLANVFGKVRAEGLSDVAGIVDVVPSFRSLTVYYNPLLSDGIRLGEVLARMAETSGTADATRRSWRIPVCFDEEFAPDLNDLAVSKALSRDNVIALMTEATFQVYMIGFMSGFPYMGGLPPSLEMPRLASPRKSVPVRSLAIAGAMCAVYPWESAGGWRLLDRTPVPFFSADAMDSPSLLASSDCVCWQAIDRVDYDKIEADVKVGQLDRDQFLLPSGVK